MASEIVEKTIIEEAIKASFKTVLEISKTIGLKITEKVKINKAIKNYVENYIDRHGQIKVLGMPKPISLQSIYINVDVNPPHYLYSYQSIDGLEDNYRKNNSRRFHHHTETRKLGVEIANKEQFLNVLGAPGAGKSTFLKRIGLEALLQNDNNDYSSYNHGCLPIFIDLKKFKNEDINLLETINDEFINCEFPDSYSFVSKCLEHGKLLILLDGLDEVPAEKIDSVITHIVDFTDKYKKNRFITSCRTAFYKTYFKKYTDVEISDFDNNQITQFARNWFSNREDFESNTADNFIELLFNIKHKSTLELARTPLLLTFLCLTYDSSSQLPPNRSLLYKRALYILLEKWAAEKRVHNDDIYQDFHADIEVEMLAEIASSMYEMDKIFFSKNELTQCINAYINNILNIGKRVNTSKIIEAIEIHQGLLVERASDIYSFSHLTIQEYLTSYYFFSQSKIPELVKNHLFDPKWREVFLLLSGMSNSDKLLIRCSEQLKLFAKENEVIIKYLKWVQNIVIHGEDAEANLARRLFALSIPLQFVRNQEEWHIGKAESANYELIALQTMNLLNNKPQIELYANLNRKRTLKTIDSFKSIDFLKINSDPFIESIKNEEDKPIRGLVGSINKQNKKYLNLILQCLGFDINQYKPGFVKFKPIIEYLNACELIITCKRESMTISKDAWEKVCNNMVSFDE